jgi:hypothetical protein
MVKNQRVAIRDSSGLDPGSRRRESSTCSAIGALFGCASGWSNPLGNRPSPTGRPPSHRAAYAVEGGVFDELAVVPHDLVVCVLAPTDLVDDHEIPAGARNPVDARSNVVVGGHSS